MPYTRPNIFAGPYVDRLEPRRGDAAAVAAALADPSARLVPGGRRRLPPACLRWACTCAMASTRAS
jgi:hypothetical protein